MKRERFMTDLLMPTVHTMGKDGWDLAAAVEKLKATVGPDDLDSVHDVVAGCECILRAIREVDESEVPTVPPPKPKGGWGKADPGVNRAKPRPAAPPSAYMMFSKTKRAEVIAAHPELSFGQVGKALGKMWGKIPEEEKEAFKRLALVDAEEKAAAKAAAAAEAEAAAEAAERAEMEAKAAAAKAAMEEKAAAAEQEAKATEATGAAPPPTTAAAADSPTASNEPDLSGRRRHFRLHPKGVGVVCIRPEGLPPGTYVQDYLGEIYSPWRWYERQDAIKKREPGKDLPDFFNITLERPAEDAAGYDTLFVEAAHRCTFASRLSHSCAPNCHTVTVAVGGKLTLAQYTTRRVKFGEELCWNYSCVTESEKEYRAAICLCSSVTCKGAFLDYSGSSAFTTVMERRHDFCDRNALLIRACAEALTDDDVHALAAAGIKSAALTMPGSEPPRRCPDWLVKWAALTLQYIQLEKELLPAALMEKPLDGIVYDAGLAGATAAGVFATRIQNLVVTLDKIKYVLRQPGQCQAPFLRPLSDDEIVAHLWDGPHGILKRAVDAAGTAVGDVAAAHSSSSRGTKKGRSAPGDAGAVMAKLRRALATRPATPADAGKGLEEASRWLRSLGDHHAAAADCLLLYARTRHWCTPERYACFLSEAVRLEPLANPSAAAKKLAATFKGNLESVLKKKYQPHFVWGQLVSWFKQTVYDPSASLSAERRGAMSLPDPESAYAGKPAGYVKTERRQLLKQLAKTPARMWPTGWMWSFRNPGKVYGSPFIDAAIATSKGEEPTLRALLDELLGEGRGK